MKHKQLTLVDPKLDQEDAEVDDVAQQTVEETLLAGVGHAAADQEPSSPAVDWEEEHLGPFLLVVVVGEGELLEQIFGLVVVVEQTVAAVVVVV